MAKYLASVVLAVSLTNLVSFYFDLGCLPRGASGEPVNVEPQELADPSRRRAAALAYFNHELKLHSHLSSSNAFSHMAFPSFLSIAKLSELIDAIPSSDRLPVILRAVP